MTRALAASVALWVLLAGVARAQDEGAAPAPDAPPSEPVPVAAPVVEPERPAAPTPLAPEVAEQLARGAALFDREHYDAALTEFLAAHAGMAGHPLRHQVLFNIAFCYERSFRYDEAIVYYQRYLDEGGGADERATEVRTVLASLAQLLGRVRIETTLARYEVWVDDHHVGGRDTPIRLPAGTHTIELRAERHLPARREARVLAGRETIVAIDPEAIDAFRGLPSEVFAVSASVTLATLAAGLACGVASLVDGQALRARLAEPSGWRVTPEEVAAVEQLSLAADVLYGVAALGAVASVVLFVLTRWDGDDAVAVGPGGLVVSF